MTVNNHRDPVSGPGLFAVTPDDPDDDRWWVTDRWSIRKLAGKHRPPGSALIGWAAWLLVVLGGGLLYVSWAGQYAYLLAARHQPGPAAVASAMFDAGVIIFALLALGLAVARKTARTERVLIMACAAGSAAMSYAAADVTSPRSVVAFVAPPLFLAVVVDRVIAVYRRHRLGDDSSPWTTLGRLLLKVARLIGVVLLYTLRFLLARKETAKGLRQMVLDAAPLPGPIPVPAITWQPPPSGTKKDALLSLYRQHRDYGDRSRASQLGAELGPRVGLQPGTARSYIYAELNRSEATP